MADRVEIRLSGQEIEPAKAAEQQRKNPERHGAENHRAGEKEKVPEGQHEAEPQRQGQRETEPQQQSKTQEPEMRQSDKEKDVLKPEAPPFDSEENLKRREEIARGEREADPEMDIMTHEDWRDQDKVSHKFAQSWRRTIDDLRGKDRKAEKQRGKGKGQSR